MGHIHFFYVEPRDVGLDKLVLRAAEYNHAARVLRLGVGDRIIAVDGAGSRYSGPIIGIDKSSLTVAIEARSLEEAEPRLRLTLAQGVPKGSHFDWVVEKGTEVGISIFQPLVTAYTVAGPRGREGRWQEKARAAMKQCGRSRAPQVLPVTGFAAALQAASGQVIFLAWEEAERKPEALAARLEGVTAATLFVGPEGGFSSEEVAQAAAAGAQIISLGPRRLRSETAALTAAVRILDAAGELG